MSNMNRRCSNGLKTSGIEKQHMDLQVEMLWKLAYAKFILQIGMHQLEIIHHKKVCRPIHCIVECDLQKPQTGHIFPL